LQDIKDPRIKICNYENGGISQARNRGITQARGDYITYLDADDYWTTDKLELQVSALQQNPQAALAYSWVYFQYETEENSYGDTSVTYTGNVYADLLLKNFLHSGSNALIRKTTLDEIGVFDIQLKVVEDWDLYLRVAAEYEFVLVPKVQVFYRQSATSVTGNIQLMEYYLKLVIDRAFSTAPAKLQYLKSQSLGWTYKYLAQQYLKYQPKSFKEIKLAYLNLYRAIRIYPLNIFDTFTQFLIKIALKKSLKIILNKCLKIVR